MNYCSVCAHPLDYRIPEGDQLPRHCCPNCGAIHYQNPNIVTCTLPIWRDQILLCKRAIEPKHGLWTLPGGFLENGETIKQGALRESWEEACIRPVVQQLLAIIDLPEYHQVHMFYLAYMTSPECAPTPESSEVQLFHYDDIPWQRLAFRTVRKAIEHYLAHKNTAISGIPLLEASL